MPASKRRIPLTPDTAKAGGHRDAGARSSAPGKTLKEIPFASLTRIRRQFD
jgi:hypothetical protein